MGNVEEIEDEEVSDVFSEDQISVMDPVKFVQINVTD